MAASGHPFQIRVSNGGSAYSTGVTNNGAQTGDILFTPDMNAPTSLVYQCTNHGGMVGNIVILDEVSVPTFGTDYVDSAFVTSQINALIDGAPGTLNTLNEIAAALNDDDSAMDTLLALINAKSDLDSADAINLIDSAYIQARQTTGGGGTVDSADIIAIVDSAYIQARQSSGGGGSAITIQDEGSSLSTAASTINFVGSGVVASGTGATKTITIAGGSGGGSATAVELTQTVFNFNADSGQSSFTGLDVDSGKFQVYLNGLLLPRSDYTHNSSKVDLLVAADSGDVLEVIKFSGNDTGHVAVKQRHYIYTADSGQTLFTGSDDNSQILSYTQDRINVYLNGLLLLDSADYTQNGAGSNVTLINGATVGDIVDIQILSGSTGTFSPLEQTLFEFTADSGQTIFTGSDDNSQSLDFTDDKVTVFLNGVLLANGDYSTSNNNKVTLTTAADSGNLITINRLSGNNVGVDSGRVTTLITSNVDSAYIQARTAAGTDSAAVISLIDSAYINARVNPFDSSHVLNLVDSAYIQLRDRFQDSSGILAIVDSGYVQARQTAQDFAYSSLTGTPTIPTLGTDFVDSAEAIALIDSNYVRLRVTKSDLDMEGNKVLFGNVYDSVGGLPSATNYHGMFAHVHGTGAGYFAHAGNWTRLANYSELSTYGNSNVTTLIDSAYVQARTAAGTDSAATIALITSTVDSDYIGSKVDFTRGEFTTQRSQYTATAAQTVFNHSSIDATHLDVYINGVLQVVNDDYTASTSAVTFGTGVDSGYSVSIIERRGRVATQRALVEAKYYFTTPTPTTSITGNDDNGDTLDYSVGGLDVYLNGILLKDSDDYSTNAGTTVTLVSATDSNDIVTLINRKGVVVSPNVANYEFTATANQTSFSGADINGNTLSYAPGAIQVHMNGIILRAVDYSATNGSTINLVTAASVNDEIIVSAFSNPGQNMELYKFTADSGQTIFQGNDITGTSLAYQTGNIQVFMNGLLLNDSDDYNANNGMSVVLTSGADASDEIKIASFVSNTNAIKTNAWSAPSGTPVTATAGDKLFIDTSTAKTITLPSSASIGDEIRIIDVTGNASSNNITVSRNGHKIQGGTTDLTINVDRAGIGLVYYNVAQGWVLIEN
jgi:hypothetical protein